jgi:hypothetical protein
MPIWQFAKDQMEDNMAHAFPKLSTIGVYVDLRQFPWRIEFRRAGLRWERVDTVRPRNKIHAAILVVEELCREIPAFIDKLVSVDEAYAAMSPHRTRRYVHRDRNKLYGPTVTDLSERSHHIAGAWLATNVGSREIRQIIKEACEAAGIAFGRLNPRQSR